MIPLFKGVVSYMNYMAFDFDGTLVDFFDYDAIKELSGILNTVLDLIGYDIFYDNPFDLFDRIIEDDTFVSEKKEYLLKSIHKTISEYESSLINEATFIDGARETILKLYHKGVDIGVVTNNDEQVVKRFLDYKTGVQIPVFGRKEASLYYMKPNPYLLIQFSDYFKCSISDITFIGDSPKDYECAKSINCLFIPLAIRTNKREQFNSLGLDGNRMINSLDELLI